MLQFLHYPPQLWFGQLSLGLINGSFYALLSLGLAVIFGMLNIVNFAHGAVYMLGAFCAWFLLNGFDIPYPALIHGHLALASAHVPTHLNMWWALFLSPLIVGTFGMILQRTMLRRLEGLEPIYGLLLTFGFAAIIQGLLGNAYGSSGEPYDIPDVLSGGHNLGFMFLPNYRIFVVVASSIVCFGTWFAIERTRFGSTLRAATENPRLVQAFGINVPLMITLTYGLGVAIAAFAGVLAAPIYQVNPTMGADLIVVVFAVVVIGGMGSILGSIVSGYMLGLVEGVTKVVYPQASGVIVFVIMAIVLLLRPSGLFGRAS